MHITIDNINHTAVIFLTGRLDVHTQQEFSRLISSIPYEKVSGIICDCAELEYISCAGLRALFRLRKNILQGQFLHFVHVKPAVMAVLETAGLRAVIDVTPQKASAGETFCRSVPVFPSEYLNLSFRDFLSQKAKKMPDKVILMEEDAYTYGEIEKCAQIVAMDLYRLGVRKGTHVALCGANSVNWVITFFAIQKLGGIALLINPNLTRKELCTLSRIGDISFFCGGEMGPTGDNAPYFATLLSDEHSVIREIYDFSKTIRFKDRLEEYDAAACPQIPVEADDPAVMIFTSGTTGQPKGVVLSAFGLLNASHSNMRSVQMTQEDKPCLILPLFHIFGLITVLFAAMLADATLFIPENIRTKTIFAALSQEKCTALNAVPTMMLAIVNSKSFDPEKAKSLRVCTLAGSLISEAQMLMLQKKFPQTHFVISYGLSELAPATVTDYDDTAAHVSQTVGKPVPGIELRIHQPSKTDGTGEILLRGYSLMCGYYKLPIDEQSIDADGWLHTGDLGYLDEDGYLHINGRLKELIIRGGEKISPNAVAAAISEHEAIADVKVIGIPDSFYGESVAAALILKKGMTFQEEEMKAFLKSKIAKYKIPSNFVLYDAFPLLSNGKVDAINLKKDLIAKLV